MCFFLIFLVACLTNQYAQTKANGTVLFDINVDCNVFIDGEFVNKITANEVKKILVMGGERLLQLKSVDNKKVLHKEILSVKPNQQKVISLSLSGLDSKKPLRFENEMAKRDAFLEYGNKREDFLLAIKLYSNLLDSLSGESKNIVYLKLANAYSALGKLPHVKQPEYLSTAINYFEKYINLDTNSSDIPIISSKIALLNSQKREVAENIERLRKMEGYWAVCVFATGHESRASKKWETVGFEVYLLDNLQVMIKVDVVTRRDLTTYNTTVVKFENIPAEVIKNRIEFSYSKCNRIEHPVEYEQLNLNSLCYDNNVIVVFEDDFSKALVSGTELNPATFCKNYYY